MTIRNELLSQILTAYGGTPVDTWSRNKLLAEILASNGGTSSIYATRNELLSLILTQLGGSPLPNQTRNALLYDIAVASNANPVLPATRNQLLSDWLDAVGGKLDIDTVVIFGASIMEQSFSGTGETSTEALFAAQGATIAVHERATSGDNTTNMVARLPALISEFQSNASKTMFVIHWAGNDISQSGPYPGGASTIDANCRAMCQDLKDAGYKIALSDTTYRIPPASNPSDPYNQNVMNSIIDDFADIRLAMYDLTFNNQDTWYEVDGIHPNAVGEDMNRNHVVDTIVPYIITGPIPQPVVWEDAVIQFGLLNVYPDGSNALSINTTRTPIKNADLSVIEGASITLSGSGGHSDTLGRGNVNDPSDESISLTNNKGLLSYVYMSEGTITVDFSSANLEPAATYTVGVTASRNAVDTRNNDIVVDGTTKVLQATASPADIVTWTGVTGSSLMATGVTSTPTASGFAYIGMIQVTKE